MKVKQIDIVDIRTAVNAGLIEAFESTRNQIDDMR